MSLEEVENSIKIGDADRDDALKRLVQELNADWAANHATRPTSGDRWAYAASPRVRGTADAGRAGRDPLRVHLQPAKVQSSSAVARSCVNSAPFRNAREPLAQAFKPMGAGRDDAFVVIVNHFKSKGDSTGTATGDNVDKGDGAGSYNGDRASGRRAGRLRRPVLLRPQQIDKVFLTGDYNAYAQEDPIKVSTGGRAATTCTGERREDLQPSAALPARSTTCSPTTALRMVTGEDGVVDQRQRVGLLRVQPRSTATSRTCTPPTRSAPPTTTRRSSASTSATRLRGRRPSTRCRSLLQRLPRPNARRPDQRRGGCCVHGGCGQAAARREPATPCSRWPAT